MSSADLAYNLLKEVEEHYRTNNNFLDEHLQSLSLFFGESLLEAFELLERPRVTKYETVDGKNCIYVINKGFEQFILFENINFCACSTFKDKVLLSQQAITCQHMLAVVFSKITNKLRTDKLTQEQFNEFLENELNNLKESEETTSD